MCLIDLKVAAKAEIKVTSLTAPTGQVYRIPANPARIGVMLYNEVLTFQPLVFKPAGTNVSLPLNYFDGSTITYGQRPYLLTDFPGIVNGELFTTATSGGAAYYLIEIVLPVNIDATIQALKV